MLIQTAVAVAGRSFIRQMDSLDERQLFRSSWKCPGKLSHGSLARIPIILYGSHNITYKQIMTKSDALCCCEWLIYNNGIHLWFLYTFRLWFVLVAVRRMSNSTHCLLDCSLKLIHCLYSVSFTVTVLVHRVNIQIT